MWNKILYREIECMQVVRKLKGYVVQVTQEKLHKSALSKA